MQSFTDKAGTSWPIEITSGDIVRLKSASTPKLQDLAPGELQVPAFNLFESGTLKPCPRCREARAAAGAAVACEACEGKGVVPLSQLLHMDLAVFWDCLWLLLEPVANERNIGVVQFGKLMSGSCLYLAQAAFFKEWADFFRQIQRPNEAAALEKLCAYQAKAVELISVKLAGQEMKDLDAMVATQMESTLNDSFGKLRDSLASIPDPTRSGN